MCVHSCFSLNCNILLMYVTTRCQTWFLYTEASHMSDFSRGDVCSSVQPSFLCKRSCVLQPTPLRADQSWKNPHFPQIFSETVIECEWPNRMLTYLSCALFWSAAGGSFKHTLDEQTTGVKPHIYLKYIKRKETVWTRNMMTCSNRPFTGGKVVCREHSGGDK